MERTLVLIKPDGVKANLIGEIIARYVEGGLKVVAVEGPFMASQEVVNKHYPLDNYEYILTLGHVDVSQMTEEEKKAKYDMSYKVVQNLQEYLMEGPIVKMVLEGENAAERVREITGKTNPAASPKGTIRGDFGTDSFEVSDKEGRAVRNLIHASDKETAAEEIKLWFPNL